MTDTSLPFSYSTYGNLATSILPNRTSIDPRDQHCPGILHATVSSYLFFYKGIKGVENLDTDQKLAMLLRLSSLSDSSSLHPWASSLRPHNSQDSLNTSRLHLSSFRNFLAINLYPDSGICSMRNGAWSWSNSTNRGISVGTF